MLETQVVEQRLGYRRCKALCQTPTAGLAFPRNALQLLSSPSRYDDCQQNHGRSDLDDSGFRHDGHLLR